MESRRAKIICTLGPSVASEESIKALIDAGMNVARLNFSHGTHEDHATKIALTRKAAARAGKHVALLADLCGLKVRMGCFKGREPLVHLNERVHLVEAETAEYPLVPITFPDFAAGLEKGDRVLADDGRVAFLVVEKTGGSVICVAETDGLLRDHVGVHLPARSIRGSCLTDKDVVDLEFALAQQVDLVAASFVRSAGDIRHVRRTCEQMGRRVPIIAKIETPPAIEALDDVVCESDGVMVARGDLGVEFPLEAVPVLQRQIIETAHKWRRPVVVATEMLHSMVHATRPTRAEASDVAHAIFDDADAVMLSAESASGDHPTLAVETMSRIICTAERSFRNVYRRPQTAPRASVSDSIACNAADIAVEIGAKLIVAFTVAGGTAFLVSYARPTMPLVAFSPSPDTVRRLALCWGVNARVQEQFSDPETMLQAATYVLVSEGMIGVGDKIVAVFGSPVGVGTATNSIRVQVVE